MSSNHGQVLGRAMSSVERPRSPPPQPFQQATNGDQVKILSPGSPLLTSPKGILSRSFNEANTPGASPNFYSTTASQKHGSGSNVFANSRQHSEVTFENANLISSSLSGAEGPLGMTHLKSFNSKTGNNTNNVSFVGHVTAMTTRGGNKKVSARSVTASNPSTPLARPTFSANPVHSAFTVASFGAGGLGNSSFVANVADVASETATSHSGWGGANRLERSTHGSTHDARSPRLRAGQQPSADDEVTSRSRGPKSDGGRGAATNKENALMLSISTNDHQSEKTAPRTSTGTQDTSKQPRQQEEEEASRTSHPASPVSNKEGKEDASAGGEKDGTKNKKNTCTISLIVIFALQCLLIVCAFAAIIGYAISQTTKTSRQLIDESLQSALAYVGAEVAGPFNAIEKFMVEYRARYEASGVMSANAYFPCDDRFVNSTHVDFQSSVTFYSDMAIAISSGSVGGAWVVRPTSPIDLANISLSNYSEIAGRLSHCSATYTSIYRRYEGATLTSTRLPATSELADLNGIPLNTNPDPKIRADNHEGLHVTLTLLALQVDSYPIFAENVGVFMVYATPVVYTFTNTTTNLPSFGFQAELPMLDLADRPDVSDLKSVVSFGVGYAMSGFFDLLRSVTPSDPRSHTTLYDLKNALIMATTKLPRLEQYDANTKQLYTYGEAPLDTVNNAFFESNVYSQQPNTIRVDFDHNKDNRVISSFVMELPFSGSTYGVVQSTPIAFYFNEVNRLRDVMIILGVLCCAVVVAICIAVAVGIFHGIGQLLDNMALAAQMKNDRTSYIVTFLHEVDRLAKGFGKMNDKLLEARAYLPQHLLVTSSDESGHDDGDDEEGALAADAGSRPVSLSTRTSVHSRGQGSSAVGTPFRKGESTVFDGSTANTGTNNTQTTAGSNVRRGAMGKLPANVTGASNGVMLKRVTILSINARGFHASVNAAAPATVPLPVNDITEAAASFASTNKGVIDSFHGDHFVVSFNAARSNAEGPVKAARCALDFADASLSRGKHASMGISTGRACVGHLGTATLKRLSIIGPVYSKAMALERVCRRFNPRARDQKQQEALDDNEYPIQVIVDSAMATEVQHHFTLQVLGGLYGAPYTEPLVHREAAAKERPSGLPMFGADSAIARHVVEQPRASSGGPVLEVIHAVRCAVSRGGEGDEWLYELQASKSGFVGQINKAMEAYARQLLTTRILGAHDPLTSLGVALVSAKESGKLSSGALPHSMCGGSVNVSPTTPQLKRQSFSNDPETSNTSGNVESTAYQNALSQLGAAVRSVVEALKGSEDASEHLRSEPFLLEVLCHADLIANGHEARTGGVPSFLAGELGGNSVSPLAESPLGYAIATSGASNSFGSKCVASAIAADLLFAKEPSGAPRGAFYTGME